MRYEITYESTYRYSGPVVGNLNRLRMRPTTDGTQRCEHFDVSVEPVADRLNTYEDLFGNEVHELLVAAPTQRLHIQVDTTVATTDPMPPPDGPWTEVQDERYRQKAGAYRYHPYAYLHEHEALAGLVKEIRGKTPAETVRNVARTIHERFAYTPGVTDAHTTKGLRAYAAKPAGLGHERSDAAGGCFAVDQRVQGPKRPAGKGTGMPMMSG